MGISLISNPPYNMPHKLPDLASFMSRYIGYPLPPEGNANYAFILTALESIEDRAVVLLPNGVLSTSQKQERQIRELLIRNNLLLAVITLPGGMFESTSIPTCLLVFDKHKQTQRIALIDLKDQCTEEVRNQRGQFGGTAHTGRTYHKTVNIIPDEIMDKCMNLLDRGEDESGLCVWASPEQILENDCNLTPSRYFAKNTEIRHRSFEDIANDFNRIISQKNAIKIKMNKTAAKRLGYDCMDHDKPDLTEAFAVVGQKSQKEDFLSFSADDGIRISISTKNGIHPLMLDFLNHWKQMIMYLNTEENRLLAEFRDALLPELMSGRIDICDSLGESE